MKKRALLGSLLSVLFVGMPDCKADVKETGNRSSNKSECYVLPTANISQSVGKEESTNPFLVLMNPYKDDLGFELKDEIATKEKRLQFKQKIEQSSFNEFTKELYKTHLDRLEKQMDYVEQNKEALLKSVQSLSQLGDPASERKRTAQSFKLDNLDVTGFFVKPGRLATLNVYVESKAANQVFLVAQAVGKTDTNQGKSLKKEVIRLKEGFNQVTLDLRGSIYGKMLYLRNNSSEPAKVRMESADAYETGKIEGTNLGKCPVFIYDGKNGEQFYQYLKDIQKYLTGAPDDFRLGTKSEDSSPIKDQSKEKTGSTSVWEGQDMTVLQLGRTQMEIPATVLTKIAMDEKLDTPEACQKYIENAFKKAEERVELLDHYAGFSKDDSGNNVPNPMRVCINFTSTVKKPSTMYATDFYYHLPAAMVENVLNGKEMYSWAMCHEYGHMLDCKPLVLAEHTNNLYAIWGRRHDAIETYKETGNDGFANLAKIYHPQIAKQTDNMFRHLKNMVKYQQPDDVFDKHNKFYHTLCWFLGTHYFDNWDYQQYDFAKSPYTKELADEVKKYGTYGTALRIMRSDEGKKIEGVTQNHYHRMILAFTEACGYNFAKYMEKLGETDIPLDIKEACAKYPDMPRKVEYYSLIADGKQITGAKPYESGTRPDVSMKTTANDQMMIEAELPGEEAQKSTVMYELYYKDQLIDLSRTGQFMVAEKGNEFDKKQYSVIAYDCFLNPSDKGEMK